MWTNVIETQVILKIDLESNKVENPTKQTEMYCWKWKKNVKNDEGK